MIFVVWGVVYRRNNMLIVESVKKEQDEENKISHSPPKDNQC